jgi:glycerophosphoryl diester phosphodiesterase
LLHSFARPYKFLRLRGLRVQAVGFSKRRLPTRAIHQAELRELMVYAYTVNSRRTAKKLAERGVKAVVTNRPDKLQTLREEP